jgi:microcystin-dependent protein
MSTTVVGSEYQPPGLQKTLGKIGRDSSKFDRTKPYDPDEKPLPPVNMHVMIRVHEVKTRLEFRAILRCDPLTPNTCQADIDKYIFQMRFVNGAGVPQEYDFDTEHPPSKVVIHTKRIDAKEVFDSDNDEPHVAWKDLPKPKQWYVQGRARIQDKHHRKSDWTAWTDPVLPFQEALPKPPAPVITDLSFFKDNGARETKYEARVQFNNVQNWDVPGGDKEDDMARYIWKAQIQIGGTGAWRLLDKGTIEDVDSDEDDGPTTGKFTFRRVHRRHKYRVKMRSVDRWNRRGDWTTWFPSTSGVSIASDTPPQVTIMRYIDLKKRRGVVWEAPEDATDINNDIKKIELQIAKSSAFSTITEKHMKSAGHGVYRYLVPRTDWDVNHFIRLRTVDGEGDRGPWQPSASGQLLNGVEGDEFDADTPGTIKKHAGPNTPTGWLRANGTLYATSLYPALFAEIGYTYGGSGVNFAVPDFRRRHPRGVGAGQSLGENENQVEGERQDGHGSHQGHRHKHHHKRRRKDHSDDGGGGSEGNATPHDHFFSVNTNPASDTVTRATGANNAAGPGHNHFVNGFTNNGGDHSHGITQGSRRSPGSPFTGGFGQTAHVNHEDTFVEHADFASIYQDSLTGGSRFDGTSWDAGPTDTGGSPITIDESGAPSGHKQHGHLRVHFIIKT